jgi:hypothetical protein
MAQQDRPIAVEVGDLEVERIGQVMISSARPRA